MRTEASRHARDIGGRNRLPGPMKILKVVIKLIAVGAFGYLGYDYYKAGLHTRPEIPSDSFSLSFVGGPRVIVQGLPDESQTRKYIARRIPSVPEWFKDSWSFCVKPSEVEATEILERVRPGPGMRLDAACALDADGDTVPTAYIFSVPKL